MSRESKIHYNPAWSVKEMARRSGVTEAAVRYYIKINGIDRRYDRRQMIIEECRTCLKKYPNATREKIHVLTGYSLSTIRKHWDFIKGEDDPTDFNSNKTKRRQSRQPNNFYATHPSVTQDILTIERFHNKVLEPFCGIGTMAEVIKNNGYDVEAYDLINRGYGKVGDFFKVDYPENEYDIISNPPYDETLISIVQRCCQLCNYKVALLLPLDYLSGAKRAKLYKNLPPRTVYVYSNRIKIGKNGTFDDTTANKMVFAWYVWEKGYMGATRLKMITNKGDQPPVVREMSKAKAEGYGLKLKTVLRMSSDGTIQTFFRERKGDEEELIEQDVKAKYREILSKIPIEEIKAYLAERTG